MKRKLDKKDLEKIQNFITRLNSVLVQVGTLEIQKSSLVARTNQIKIEQQKFLQEIEKEYGLEEGNFNIDFSTGRIAKSEE